VNGKQIYFKKLSPQIWGIVCIYLYASAALRNT